MAMGPTVSAVEQAPASGPAGTPHPAASAAPRDKQRLIGAWSSRFGTIGGPLSMVVCMLLVLRCWPAPGRLLPLSWNLAIFAVTFAVIAAMHGLGALFGYLVWLVGRAPAGMGDR